MKQSAGLLGRARDQRSQTRRRARRLGCRRRARDRRDRRRQEHVEDRLARSARHRGREKSFVPHPVERPGRPQRGVPDSRPGRSRLVRVPSPQEHASRTQAPVRALLEARKVSLQAVLGRERDRRSRRPAAGPGTCRAWRRERDRVRRRVDLARRRRGLTRSHPRPWSRVWRRCTRPRCGRSATRARES